MKVETEHLWFSYDQSDNILKDVSFTVSSGSFFVMIGPNGSGKTTLLNQIGGILSPDRGNVFLGDKPIAEIGIKDLARRVAALEQESFVGFNFTVREIVAMGLYPHLGRFDRSTDSYSSWVTEALEFTDTLKLASRSINSLSGGEKQRVFLALALAQRPQILLLDEPTVNLDINYQLQILNLVSQLSNSGLTVVSALHDLNLAANFADKLGVFTAGDFEELGSPQQVVTTDTLGDCFGVNVNIENRDDGEALYIHPEIFAAS